jgi:hypothetical protein
VNGPCAPNAVARPCNVQRPAPAGASGAFHHQYAPETFLVIYRLVQMRGIIHKKRLATELVMKTIAASRRLAPGPSTTGPEPLPIIGSVPSRDAPRLRRVRL